MILARVTLEGRSNGVLKLSRFFTHLEPGGAVMTQVLRRVLVFGILRSVRTQFLARQANAFNVDFVAKNPDPAKALKERIEEERSNQRDLARLRAAYEQLDEAMLSARKSRKDAAIKAVREAEDKIHLRSAGRAQSALGKKRNDREFAIMTLSGELRLGATTGNLMRLRVMRVLEYFTSAMYLSDVQVENGRATLGAGPRSLLDLVETPSATAGGRSRSQRRTLWRHLEFGSGIYASKQQETLLGTSGGAGKTKQADGSWIYGAAPGGEQNGGGLLVRGTKPMNFLWSMTGSRNLMHEARALQALDDAMRALVPKLSGI